MCEKHAPTFFSPQGRMLFVFQILACLDFCFFEETISSMPIRGSQKRVKLWKVEHKLPGKRELINNKKKMKYFNLKIIEMLIGQQRMCQS